MAAVFVLQKSRQPENKWNRTAYTLEKTGISTWNLFGIRHSRTARTVKIRL